MKYNKAKIRKAFKILAKAAHKSHYRIYILETEADATGYVQLLKDFTYTYNPGNQAEVTSEFKYVILYGSYLKITHSMKEIILTIAHELSHSSDATRDDEGEIDWKGYKLAKQAGFNITFKDLLVSLQTLTYSRNARVKQMKEFYNEDNQK